MSFRTTVFLALLFLASYSFAGHRQEVVELSSRQEAPNKFGVPEKLAQPGESFVGCLLAGDRALVKFNLLLAAKEVFPRTEPKWEKDGSYGELPKGKGYLFVSERTGRMSVADARGERSDQFLLWKFSQSDVQQKINESLGSDVDYESIRLVHETKTNSGGIFTVTWRVPTPVVAFDLDRGVDWELLPLELQATSNNSVCFKITQK